MTKISSSFESERRSTIRISPKGSVILRVGEQEHRGRVGDISRHGMLAITLSKPSPTLATTDLEIALRLDGASGEWMQLTGRVTRVDDCAVAIVFTHAPSSFLELMVDSSSASHGHRRVMSVVLVDGTLSRRLALAEAFRAAGCTVSDVSTPLEAIVKLGESRFEPDLIAIADSLPASTADELRTFVEHAHPAAKLVTIGDTATEPDGLAHWLSSVPEDLLVRVRELLGARGRQRAR